MHIDPEEIQKKLNYLDNLLTKLESGEKINSADILRMEILQLKNLSKKYTEEKNLKEVVKVEDTRNKKRYFLKDGSTFVVSKDYKYLYDANTKTVTYEFPNGQIERTFDCGIKEIRQKDGKLVIKHNSKDIDIYEPIKREGIEYRNEYFKEYDKYNK